MAADTFLNILARPSSSNDFLIVGMEKPSEKTVCRACHYMGPAYAMGQFTHGEMNCITCHVNLKEKRVGPAGHGLVGSGEM